MMVKKIRVLAPLLVITLLAGIFATAAGAAEERPLLLEKRLEFQVRFLTVLNGLGITPEQAGQLAELLQDTRDEARRLAAARIATLQELKERLLAGEEVKSANGDMPGLPAGRNPNRLLNNLKERIAGMLTADQLEKLKDWQQERKTWFEYRYLERVQNRLLQLKQQEALLERRLQAGGNEALQKRLEAIKEEVRRIGSQLKDYSFNQGQPKMGLPWQLKHRVVLGRPPREEVNPLQRLQVLDWIIETLEEKAANAS